MKNRFDISRISSFATLLLVLLFVFLFLVKGLAEEGALMAYSPVQKFIDGYVVLYPNLFLALNGLLVFGSAVLLGRISTIHSIHINRCYLAAIFFAILSMALGCGAFMFRVYLAAYCFILAAGHVFKVRNAKRVVGYRWFVCGFWIAIGSIIYLPAMFAILAIIVGVALFRMNSPREYLIAFGGVALVVVLTFSFYIICGVEMSKLFEGYKGFFSMPTIPNFQIQEIVFVGITALIVVLAIVKMFGVAVKGRADLIKGILFFVIVFFIGAAGAVFTKLGSREGMPLMAVCLAMIMPLCFTVSKRRLIIYNTIFFCYLASVFALFLN